MNKKTSSKSCYLPLSHDCIVCLNDALLFSVNRRGANYASAKEAGIIVLR